MEKMDSSGSKGKKTNVNKLREIKRGIISTKQKQYAFKIKQKRRAKMKLIKYLIREMENSVDGLENKGHKIFHREEQKDKKIKNLSGKTGTLESQLRRSTTQIVEFPAREKRENRVQAIVKLIQESSRRLKSMVFQILKAQSKWPPQQIKTDITVKF